MRLPTQSRPALRDSRRRPWRGKDQFRLGILPCEGEEEYGVEEPDESAESDDSGEE